MVYESKCEQVFFMITLSSILEALLIVIALSIDAFVSSFAYGTNKIKIPGKSILVINLICTGSLGLALLFGSVLSLWIPEGICQAICFLLLLFLGVIKIFDSAVKSFIRKQKDFQKRFHFSLCHMGFILKVYANPEEADRDHSRILSPKEAAFLAVALSLDGLTVGFGAGIGHSITLIVLLFSLVADTLAITLGSWLGIRFTEKLKVDLSWISGALLLLLAIMKLP